MDCEFKGNPTHDLLAQRSDIHGQHAGLGLQFGHGGFQGSSDRLCDLASVRGLHDWRVVVESGIFQALGDDLFDRVFIDGFVEALFNGVSEVFGVDLFGVDTLFAKVVEGGVGDTVRVHE